MENIDSCSLSIDKLISRQGLLISLDKSLNQLNVVPALRFPQITPTTEVVPALRFLITPTTEVVAPMGFANIPTTPQVIAGSVRFFNLPRGSIAKLLKEGAIHVAEYIWDKAPDILKIIYPPPPDDKEEEHLPQLPAPSPAPAPLVSKPWLQLFKGRNIPLDFHPYVLLAGFGAAVALAAIVLFRETETAKVSVFSRGGAVRMFSEVSNDKRFAGIFSDAFGALMIHHFLRGPFLDVGDGGEVTLVQLCTWLSGVNEGSFILCISSREILNIAIRGGESFLVGGALIDGVVSPILFDLVDAGGSRHGTFAINDTKFVVFGSSVLLDALNYQQIVDLVPPKGTDIAERIFRAALESDPAIENLNLNVAVMYLT